MTLSESLFYLVAFASIWLFACFLAALLDKFLRKRFNIKFFPDDYWKPSSNSSMTHCHKCEAILIDRDYCRNCGEVNI